MVTWFSPGAWKLRGSGEKWIREDTRHDVKRIYLSFSECRKLIVELLNEKMIEY